VTGLRSPTPDGSVVYFAYGANLHPGWLRRRVRSAAVIGAAELPGHRIEFRKRGRDDSGKSDACPTGLATDRLAGALYRLSRGDLQRLGAAEAGYYLDEITVESAEGALAAVTWRADPAQLVAGLPPWNWYLALLRAGAAIHGLPESYRHWLESVVSVPDPDGDRAAIALEVIAAWDRNGFASS
jgi:gamma-glutamylcyclotransferase